MLHHIFLLISLKKKDILPDFLVWLLNQTPTQRYFEQNAEGTLTKSIRRSVLEDVPVVVPALAKQRAIISMAATLRDEHKLIQKLVSNGERMMSAIAKDLFENKEVSP
ncbi:putative restriction modification system DNA specificity domain protein [Vibrio paracholerae]|nr:putative restriction modification system DNA specificity domain protein [Vibrio paracholerae]